MKKAARSKTPEAKEKDGTKSAVKLNKRGLPEHFCKYFWDCDFETVTWRKHKEDVVRRILVRGNWDDLLWIRARVGDAWLRQWMMKRKGRGLERQDVRFWGLILKIPPRTVTSWLNDESRQVWDQRSNPNRAMKTS